MSDILSSVTAVLLFFIKIPIREVSNLQHIHPDEGIITLMPHLNFFLLMFQLPIP
jgi:hypothetical protein